MITILACYERISLYHTMIPFFLKNRELRKKSGINFFHVTQSAEWCFKHDKNRILFMERCFQHREPRNIEKAELALLKKLRDKYKTIVFFCGQPEAGNNRLDILPFVDRLFYKSVFSNPNDYRKNLYGKNLFADYYHRSYGVTDTPEYLSYGEVPEEDVRKPELSWNIGVGTYPRFHWPQRMGTILARAGLSGLSQLIGGKPLNHAERPIYISPKKTVDFSGSKRRFAVHARIDPVNCLSIAYQRWLFLNCIKKLIPKKRELFLTGIVSQNQYYRELTDSKIVLSPFGWGEVCFRDFEAILAGALLFKPSMSHLLTWPNVYIPYETYIPLKWDGSDLLEQTEHYLDNERERSRIAANAYEQYRNELSALSRRFDLLLGEYYL
jgi:hypothetical protein